MTTRKHVRVSTIDGETTLTLFDFKRSYKISSTEYVALLAGDAVTLESGERCEMFEVLS